MSPDANDVPHYATHEEVVTALHGLSPDDRTKLLIIARTHCRQRNLTPSVMEPLELFSEAVKKSLECETGKRWNKKVSILKHLDRAMENISGHLAGQRSKIYSFPDGLQPDEADFTVPGPEEQIGQLEEAAALLDEVFGDDAQAQAVFALRAEKNQPEEIQRHLQITPTEYQTVNRRILRRIAAYTKSTKSKGSNYAQ